MKGLLHRLAARAAGTAVALRSDARLPYGADGLAWGDAPQNPLAWMPEEECSRATALGRTPPQQVESTRGGPAPTREAVSVAVPASERRSRSNAESFEQDGPMDAVFREPAAPRSAVPEASPFARVAPPLHETSPAAAEPVALHGRIDAPPPMLPPAAPAAETGEPAAIAPELPRGAAWLSAAPAWRQSPHPLPPAASADPVPLLPAASRPAAGAASEPASHRSAPAQPEMAWPLASTASQTDAATEVHIHIGRIEVTAVHEAPKVRVKSGAKSPALSLDAYLAARNKA